MNPITTEQPKGSVQQRKREWAKRDAEQNQKRLGRNVTPPPLGVIDRIALAQSPDEVAALVAHSVGFEKATDKTLRRINRAAVKRNKELSRP